MFVLVLINLLSFPEVGSQISNKRQQLGPVALTKTLRLLQLAYVCDRREVYWLHSDRNNEP